jgi:glycerol-3-phosphate dehydrogenase (NAD(P)+)
MSSDPALPFNATPYRTVSVVGAGAWGTALACVAAAGANTLLWAREADVVESVNAAHENRRFLAGVSLPHALHATGDLAQAAKAEAILLVPPAQFLRSTLASLKGLVAPGTPVVLCAKGIEDKTGKLLTEVLAEILPDISPAMLSGPSFARDVARGLPTAVTVAAQPGVAERLQATLGRPSHFRPYVTDDLVGVALGGAAKNVYAIACGVVMGEGFGESARAALLARGFAELLRLGAALGARPETLMGLSGLGDLALTATTTTSRNFSLGVALGKGETLKDITGEGKPLAEGAATAPALVMRAKALGVELPIAEAVASVLSGKFSVGQATERLLARPVGTE